MLGYTKEKSTHILDVHFGEKIYTKVSTTLRERKILTILFIMNLDWIWRNFALIISKFEILFKNN